MPSASTGRRAPNTPGPRQTSVGASASGQAVTVDVRTGGPGRQTTGAMTVTGTGRSVGRSAVRSQGRADLPPVSGSIPRAIPPSMSDGPSRQKAGAQSSRRSAAGPGRRARANRARRRTFPGRIHDDGHDDGRSGRRRPANATRSAPASAPGATSASSRRSRQQGTRIFKTKQEAEAFRNNAAALLTVDRTTAAPATADDATRNPRR